MNNSTVPPTRPEDCPPGQWFEITYNGRERVVAQREARVADHPWSMAGAASHYVSDRVMSDPVLLVPITTALETLAEQTVAALSALLPDDLKLRAERAEKALEEEQKQHADTIRVASEHWDDLRNKLLASEARADGSVQMGRDAITDLANALQDAIEHAGTDRLPLDRGWPWFDMLEEYAPDVLDALADRGARRLAHIAFDHDAWPDLSEDSRETFRRLDRAGVTATDKDDRA